MSVDYLAFKYHYNLIVEDNSNGFEWKPLCVCSESKVLFDKHKVIQYFDWFEIYSNYENDINNNKLYESSLELDLFAEINTNYRIESFFVPFIDIFLDEINFVEFSNLIVNAKELFECSAKLHFINQSIDLNVMKIGNCFEMFEIKTTVKANNLFGICYEFFETNSSIVLKEDDFIRIIIKFKKQKNIIFTGVHHDDYQYFRWYYFINNKEDNNALKSSLVYSTRIGLSAELKISKTSIEMLSIPYMTYCEHSGCRHDFYKIKIDNDFFEYNNDTVIEIKSNKKKQLIYHAEPNLQLVDLISNIGGLFGLYFGLSFIDVSHIFKTITRRIRNYLKSLIFYRKIKALIEYLKLSQLVILKYIKRITKIPWKFILTFLFSPFFISKMFDLIINYFNFPTKISFDFVEYQQNHQKISINEFPAITLCTEHMFEKALFDQYYAFMNKQIYLSPRMMQSSTDGSKCWYFYRQNINLTTSNINIFIFIVNHCKYNFPNENIFKYLSKYFDINNEEEYYQVIKTIEDKYRYGLNGTLDMLDFYVNHHNCWTLYEPNIECEDFKPTIKMLSPFGKCHTYLMGNNNNQTLSSSSLLAKINF